MGIFNVIHDTYNVAFLGYCLLIHVFWISLSKFFDEGGLSMIFSWVLVDSTGSFWWEAKKIAIKYSNIQSQIKTNQNFDSNIQNF